MKNQRHVARARVAAAGVVAGVLLAGCGAANESAPAGGAAPSAGGTALSGTISGAGASSQQAAMQAWIAGFTGANPDATVNYDPAGSGAGRTQFISGGVDFAGSDAYLKADELTKAQERCKSDVVEVPAYISPIAVIYNLPGVTDLQLSAATVAAEDPDAPQLTIGVKTSGAQISGGSADDTIVAGTGQNQVRTGGGGADVFVFLKAGQHVTITDFDPTLDKIELQLPRSGFAIKFADFRHFMDNTVICIRIANEKS